MNMNYYILKYYMNAPLTKYKYVSHYILIYCALNS